MVFNDCRMLVLSIIVTGNRAGADIGFFANRSVAQIGQVHGFCAAPNARFLHFNEVSDDRAFFHLRIHAQMSKWADGAIIGNT